jgi:ATP adenylyltransferase
MMIVPRRAETATVPVDIEAAGDIADPGVVSLNGTVLAGTLMVKAEAEWDVLRSRPEVLVKLLRDVGFPREREGMALL